MSQNFYSEINLHITWHTKESAPLLVPPVEAVVHHYLRGRCISTPGGMNERLLYWLRQIGGQRTTCLFMLSISWLREG